MTTERTRVAPTRLRPADAAREAVSAILTRPGRAALTALGTLLGIAAFVAVLGLTATASGQISQRFTALAATEVSVEDAPADPSLADAPFPDGTERRLTALNGVVNAGVHWQPATGPTSARPPGLAAPDDAQALPVMAASPGYLAAVHARPGEGRLYDAFHEDRKQRVCVLGRAAAARLGVTRLDAQPAIFVDGVALTVVGIIDGVDRRAEVLLSVIVPTTTAAALWGPPDPGDGRPARLLVETRLGAAPTVARQVAVAIRADQPERFKVVAPPDPRTLRDQVDTDLGFLFLGLAAVSLVIGAVGIANTTLVSVLERTAEIGLRRALGARRRHIALQFLAESSALGLLGGLLGTALGVAVVVTASAARHWTPILEPLTVLPSPLLGALTGALAGLYPSWRATRTEPTTALRA
ncbi:ABC transporter permease [Actinocorallia sp. API 0066]|uniref:ABC transporter permease n=1 Tax=Actinocorallia sp. API 0066 TaxID=2896846 RepID=UPI001E3D2E55|nr:ABC transporter permease [Actinocorallia sp. API 0066]MCD0450543.1 ABC transporter permease [Actinocorallia sp. API 0066]